MLAALARSVFDQPARDALLSAKTLEEAVRALDEHGRRLSAQTPGAVGMASVAGM